MSAEMVGILVDGIVAARDLEPYVRITVNGERAQLSIAEAHKIATDLLKMAARTEADAAVLSFASKSGLSKEAAAALMKEFREFRHRQDEQPVEGVTLDPESGERIR